MHFSWWLRQIQRSRRGVDLAETLYLMNAPPPPLLVHNCHHPSLQLHYTHACTRTFCSVEPFHTWTLRAWLQMREAPIFRVSLSPLCLGVPTNHNHSTQRDVKEFSGEFEALRTANWGSNTSLCLHTAWCVRPVFYVLLFGFRRLLSKAKARLVDLTDLRTSHNYVSM